MYILSSVKREEKKTIKHLHLKHCKPLPDVSSKEDLDMHLKKF